MSVRVAFTAMRPVSGGVAMPTTAVTVGGVEYVLPLPFQQVIRDAVVIPVFEPDEDRRAISMRVDQWQVGHLDRQRTLPLRLVDMATAARVAREFEVDPGISWHSDEADLEAWAVAWLERERASTGGGR